MEILLRHLDIKFLAAFWANGTGSLGVQPVLLFSAQGSVSQVLTDLCKLQDVPDLHVGFLGPAAGTLLSKHGTRPT